MTREHHVRFCEGLGGRFPGATRLVVMCDTAEQCAAAECFVQGVLGDLGLELHPDKTRRVDLTVGREGFDFLGCSLRKRVSGRILARSGKCRYFLQRWPAQRAMKRVRQRVKQLTNRRWVGTDIQEVVDRLNPVLRGWGNYFRTGNAAEKFASIDGYVAWRLLRLMIKRKGRHLKAGEARQWTHDFFVTEFGLHRLRGTIRYPGNV